MTFCGEPVKKLGRTVTGKTQLNAEQNRAISAIKRTKISENKKSVWFLEPFCYFRLYRREERRIRLSNQRRKVGTVHTKIVLDYDSRRVSCVAHAASTFFFHKLISGVIGFLSHFLNQKSSSVFFTTSITSFVYSHFKGRIGRERTRIEIRD